MGYTHQANITIDCDAIATAGKTSLGIIFPAPETGFLSRIDARGVSGNGTFVFIFASDCDLILASHVLISEDDEADRLHSVTPAPSDPSLIYAMLIDAPGGQEIVNFHHKGIPYSVRNKQFNRTGIPIGIVPASGQTGVHEFKIKLAVEEIRR